MQNTTGEWFSPLVIKFFFGDIVGAGAPDNYIIW